MYSDPNSEAERAKLLDELKERDLETQVETRDMSVETDTPLRRGRSRRGAKKQ
jgi:hypothetical protein